MVFVKGVIGWPVLEAVQVALPEFCLQGKVEKDSVESAVVD